MNVLYVYADSLIEWNCSEWRCAIPTRAINQTAAHHADMVYLSDWITGQPDAEKASASADIIVVPRAIYAETPSIIERWKAAGKTIAVDLDDAYEHMPENYIAYDFWKFGKVTTHDGKLLATWPEAPIDQLKWGVKLCHGLITPSKQLCRDWEGFTRVYYVPNYLESTSYPPVPRPPSSRLSIGWGGSISHFQSWTDSGIIPAVERVARMRKVRILIAGSDARVYNALHVEDGKKFHIPSVPFKDWHKSIAQFDIGLAPLCGEYDRRRSWIKPMEYMLMGVPWIGSDNTSYDDLKPYGRVVKNTRQDWEEALLDYIDHPEARLRHVAEAQAYARSQDVLANAEEIIAVYQRIIDDRRHPITVASTAAPADDALHIQNWMEQANSAFGQGQWQAALDALGHALEVNPDNAGVYNGMGACLMQLDKMDEAIACFQRVVILAPQFPDSYNNLGVVYEQLGRMEEAEKAYKQAVALDPEMRKSRRNLAQLYLQMDGRQLEGVDMLRELVLANPSDVDSWFLYGNANEMVGDWIWAAKAYGCVLELQPEHVEVKEALQRIAPYLPPPPPAADSSRIAKTEHAAKLQSLKNLNKK